MGIQDRPINRDRGIPNFDFMMEGRVSTLDDCFPEMEKITYGARVVAKLVDDQSCDVPKYSAICEEMLQKNRTIFEGSWQSPNCTMPNDDPFRACFGCEKDATRRNFNHPSFYYYIDRQS